MAAGAKRQLELQKLALSGMTPDQAQEATQLAITESRAQSDAWARIGFSKTFACYGPHRIPRRQLSCFPRSMIISRE